MTQPNFQVDGLQIEPGSGQTLTITRQASNGAMKFVDAVVTGGLTLSDLASLSTISGVLVVGQAGAGAKYTTIQSALAAVPASASPTNPYVILVMPGVYAEALVIEKDGITIQGIGQAVIQPSSAAAAVTVQAAVLTTPRSLTLRDLTIIQMGDGLACVNLVGGSGSTVGSNGITIENCNLLPTGVGGYTVYANAVNNVILRSCWSLGAPATASMRVAQCSLLLISGGLIPPVQADYNSAGTIPSITGSEYILAPLAIGDVQSTLSGDGSLTIGSCPNAGNVTVNGNRTLTVLNSTLRDLTLNGSTAATLKNSSRGTVSGAGTLWEAQVSGTVSFGGVDTMPVTFDVSRPDANYTVAMDSGIASAPYVSVKTASGFTVKFAAPVSTTVYWTATS